jgi:dTMP kinase
VLGKLVVIEGPDGVGKSTVVAAIVRVIESTGADIERLSFPGRQTGTLGHLVYQVHHDPSRFGISEISASALQALHIAAHLDSIERRILPALLSGRHDLLDRFWWSTWVYGSVAGINRELLEALIAAEREMWGETRPAMAILLDRDAPLERDCDLVAWEALRKEYNELAERERRIHPVAVIRNTGTLEATKADILSQLMSIGFLLCQPCDFFAGWLASRGAR